ncbi:MAG TPA: cyclic beta 1-2 glucan synthetase, partial [Puia sp.]|nr:cyclic beta 1-2 glucan synthetase [Puia sp.]
MPFKGRIISLSPDQWIFLHKIARKTWSFFETFIVREDNWLPPDNYQESPVARIAHRTSPTNIGLSLLANLGAYDFGYISPSQLIERTTNTFGTMQRMERYRGHFYNWYDTQSLSPLMPKYVSTVDSGNLAGHILTLKQGLLSIINEKLYSPRVFEGLRDTMYVLEEKLDQVELIQQFKTNVVAACDSGPIMLNTVSMYLSRLTAQSEKILNDIGDENEESEIFWWANALANQSAIAFHDLLALAPWLHMRNPPEKFNDLYNLIRGLPTLNELSQIETEILPRIDEWHQLENTEEENDWLDLFKKNIIEGSRRAKERILVVQTLVKQCVDFSNIEFDFLFDRSQRLLSIGYNAEEHRRDLSFYDLLASESRLATFVGIAQGKLTQDSWFALGRQLTNPGTSPVLLSWSGSMFEYLMPLLVMPTYENTLLDQTNKAAVQRQIEYGKKRDVCWGISESGYNMVDASLNYQYRAFGVPGLG